MKTFMLFGFFMVSILGFSQDDFPGNSLYFLGTDEYVLCNGETQIAGSNSRSIEAWAYTESFNDGGIFQTGITGTDNRDFSLRTRTTEDLWRMQFWGNDFDVVLPGSKDSWHHFCMTYNGTSAKLYYDGRLMYSGDITLNTGNADMYFGKWRSHPFAGKIDEIRVWNIALDPTQIRENMYLSLDGSESGLLSYWQFNELSGSNLGDCVGGNDGTLINMDNSSWLTSSIPFGGGDSDSQNEANGEVIFANTGLSINYSNQNGASVTVSCIRTAPNLIPNDMDTVLSHQYWVVNRYGSGSFTADMIFETDETMTAEDVSHPEEIKLFTRGNNADTSWVEIAIGDTVDLASNTVAFNGISSSGQFLIAKNKEAKIAVDTNVIAFGKVNIGDTLTQTFKISNLGHDTLFVSNITCSNSVFYTNINSFQLLPNEEQEVELSFKPLSKKIYTAELSITSNAINAINPAIDLTGEGILAQAQALEYPLRMQFVSDHFNNIDVGSYSAPTFTDLDGDGLLDMIVGRSDGHLSYYEQVSVNSNAFHPVYFYDYSVFSSATPSFIDIDGNGLLDMIVGNYAGKLFRFEQSSVNSTNFVSITSYFNNIDIGNYSAPTFTDLNGDGLLDLVVGREDGYLIRYLQDSENSDSFSQSFFFSLCVGNRSTPTFTDLDGDGLLDMIVGNEDGELHHREQDSENSTSFHWVSSNFASIDVGYNSTPSFTDLDGDGLLDMIVGERDGTLNHYEQVGVDSIHFENLVGDTLVKQYYVRAKNLQDNFILQSNASNFSISLSANTGFSQMLNLIPVDGRVAERIYVRFTPNSQGDYNARIMQTSSFMDTSYVYLEGIGRLLDNYPGNALDFDGGGKYVYCNQEPQITGNHSRTIEVWAKVENFNSGGVFQTGITGEDNRDFSLRTTDTDNLWNVQFWGNDFDVLLPDSKDSWHHYCMTYDGTYAKLYYDGKLMMNEAINLNTGNGHIYFGKWKNDYFDGKIDEVHIWNIALDSIQIRESMYLSLNEYKNGLISYWQFNNNSGDTLCDIVHNNTGTLINMEDNDWVNSTIPFGKGKSDSQIEANGSVVFANVDLNISYNEQSGAAVTISRIDTLPNINPMDIDTTFQSQYWEINRYGGGTFNADIIFGIKENLTSEDATRPERIKLFRRGNTADTAWVMIAVANAVDTINNTATFTGIDDIGQFILTRNERARIFIDKTFLDFGDVYTEDSLTKILKITNVGDDTLFVSNISNANSVFSANLTSFQLLPDHEQELELTFLPLSESKYYDTLFISSNAAQYSSIGIPMIGNGGYTNMQSLMLPFQMKLKTSSFNNVDVNYYSTPCYTDIDGDGLLDLIIGEQSGNLNYYKQDSEGSTSFSLVTENFNSIDIGYRSAPTFADLDGDSLLDLIIGRDDGTLSHYEQDSIYSVSFSLQSNNFNSIDVWYRSVPAFVDLDKDGLLDLIIGNTYGKLYHYKQDCLNSTTFYLVTDNFNSIDIGNNAAPTFADLDGDGLWDMIIGEEDGNLNWYEQDIKNSTSFSLVRENFSFIDVGSNSTPTFTDIDKDGLLDMIVGENAGTLYHYEQKGADTLYLAVLKNDTTITQYFIKADFLRSDILLQSNSNYFSLSLSKNGVFSQSLSITPIDGRVSDTIYIRFSPDSQSDYNAKIMQTSTSVDTSYVCLLGKRGSVDSYPGNTLKFDGNDDYVHCNAESQITANHPRTIEAWAYADSFNDGGVFQSGITGENSRDFSLRTKNIDNYWRMQLWGNDFDVVLPGSKDSWHHYCMTYDGLNAKLYYDGRLMIDEEINLNTGSGDIYFGKWRGHYFDGKIDEIRIWNIALDSIQIRENMYLSLTGNESNLLSYWQFDEQAGDKLFDFVGGNIGTLYNMGDDDWITSTIPFGSGDSDSQIEANGNVVFASTDLVINYNSQNGAAVSVSRIDTLPNVNPTNIDTTFQSQYWEINRYGGGTFNADITFGINENLTSKDAIYPEKIKLFRRGNTADTAWAKIAVANAVDTINNTVTFTGIEEVGQFILARNERARISFDKTFFDFGDVYVGDSLAKIVKITNIGDDTLFVSNTSSLYSVFSINPTSFQLLPNQEQEVELKFVPQSQTLYSDTLLFSSNAANHSNLFIPISGNGVKANMQSLELPLKMQFVSSSFNNIDVGTSSTPCFADIDGDGLLDLIVGNSQGTLSYYEQDSEGSTSFSLVTENFNSIGVGSRSAPTFVDLDGDDLLDLIIGKGDGTLSHYEQDSIHSITFSLLSENFNSIDVGNNSNPTFIDIDDDGLLELILGEIYGKLSYYKQDSENSISFSLQTNNFNSIDVDLYSAPTFTDMDGDGLLDLIIGKNNGNLSHYEQNGYDPTSFSLITEHYNSINVGINSAPSITDVDGDGLQDMIVGEYSGNLNHYEQKAVDTLYFIALDGDTLINQYLIKARFLRDELVLQSNSNYFSLSLSENSGFSQSLVIIPTDGQVADTVYVRFIPGNENAYSAKIIQSSTFVDTSYVFLSGQIGEIDNYPGTALEFDGINDYVHCNVEPQITGDYSRTIEAWAYAESFNDGGIFQSGITGENNRDFSLRTKGTDNQWRMQFWGNDFDVVLAESKNNWHHYCMTYDGSNAKLYYDGKLMVDEAISLNTGNGDVYFGKWREDYFDGKIDEIRIWNVALDSIQIRESMHLPLTGNENTLLSYWQCNEENGNRLFDWVGSNTGNLYNMDDNDRVSSTIPFGPGDSDSQTEANGSVTFLETDLSIYYNSENGANVTAYRIDTVPNLMPIGVDSVFSSQYWLVHRYGNGSFDANLSFTLQENLTAEDEAYPSQIKLFTRGTTADTAWAEITQAASVNSIDNTATFGGISGFSQFIIGRGTPCVNLEIKAQLEGAINGTQMNTSLNSSGLLPLSQPFNISPWNYTGTESVSVIPNTDIVDWILIELRDTTEVSLASPQTMFAQKAVFVNKEGNMVGMDGIVNPILFEDVKVHNNLYVVIWHRNHLGIITAVPLTRTNGIYSYDFSTAVSQAYLSGQKLVNGKAAMVGGDANNDGTIDTNDLLLWKTKAGERGYENTDVNFDGEVDNKDKDDIGVPNAGSISNIPE